MDEIDITTIRCEVAIACDRRTAWAAIGKFEEAGLFLNVLCRLTAGVGGIGSVRQVGDSILEVMVGASRYSYTYLQIYGPMAQYGYHGCVSLEAAGVDICTLSYTLVYNQQWMDSERRRSESSRLLSRFTAAAEAMKRRAESTATAS